MYIKNTDKSIILNIYHFIRRTRCHSYVLLCGKNQTKTSHSSTYVLLRGKNKTQPDKAVTFIIYQFQGRQISQPHIYQTFKWSMQCMCGVYIEHTVSTGFWIRWNRFHIHLGHRMDHYKSHRQVYTRILSQFIRSTKPFILPGRMELIPDFIQSCMLLVQERCGLLNVFNSRCSNDYARLTLAKCQSFEVVQS